MMATPTNATLTKGRILVADDDPGLLRLLVMRLTAAGHEVRTVESGEQALVQLPLFRDRKSTRLNSSH